MINRTNQIWELGQKVNVGFMKGLTVIKKIPTPGDYAPDAYILEAANGRGYRFTPHNGIERIDGYGQNMNLGC